MADKSLIEWTDATWNPVTGCTRVSEGCRNCYMARTVPRQGLDPWKVVLHPDRLEQPIRWQKPRRIFVNSLSDLFHEDVPDNFIDSIFSVMAKASQHTFQVLTKRPDRMRKYLADSTYRAEQVGIDLELLTGLDRFESDGRQRWTFPLSNVCLGVSIEDQKTADERIPLLLRTPAAVRFVSYEPALRPVKLSRWLDGVGFQCADPDCTLRTMSRVDMMDFEETDDGDPICPSCNEVGTWTGYESDKGLDWVIAGGESGPGARPCDVAWIRSIKDQCKAAGVSCFVKQLGGYVADRNDAGFEGDELAAWPMDTDTSDRDNEWNYQGARIRIRLKDRKGGDWNEWPEDLRIRECPR